MALTLVFRPVVVPGLVPVRRPLPGVLEDSVDHCLADQDAQVHDEEGVHGPAGGGTRGGGGTVRSECPKLQAHESAATVAVLLHSGALLRFGLIVERHLGLHAGVDGDG